MKLPALACRLASRAEGFNYGILAAVSSSSSGTSLGCGSPVAIEIGGDNTVNVSKVSPTRLSPFFLYIPHPLPNAPRLGSLYLGRALTRCLGLAAAC